MRFARIVGTVTATHKVDRLDGFRLMALQDLEVDGKPSGAELVAVDHVGAGQGEVVLYTTGPTGRLTPETDARPVDALIMAVVDTVEIKGKVVFCKE